MNPARRQALRWLGAVAGGIAGASLGPRTGQAQTQTSVDLALVLAVDASLSIDDDEFRLQLSGYARAFRDPRVIAAATSGPDEVIAVTFAQWSWYGSFQQSVPWVTIGDRSDAFEFAAAIERVIRQPGSATSLSGAIEGSMALLNRVGHAPRRRVIDISGDGRNNNGPDAIYARDAAVVRGVTINGLPILTEDPWLDRYYRARVIGGPKAFVRPAASMGDFDQAVLEKLLIEIS
ncbi:MAG: DUF1194 domain-containing protein [Alphaproteobacteria bacterium]|nr:DUF1194 domain-containing protein [Alphaproteobacteria bacterium]TAD90751.1 MAG: DUF1194 domain-containing protein [Alphaproteobacteria bacterium]